MKTEHKIFFSVFILMFLSVFVTIFELIPLYYGHPLRNPLEMLQDPSPAEGGTPSSYVARLFVVILFFSSLAVSGVSVVIYQTFRRIRRS